MAIGLNQHRYGFTAALVATFSDEEEQKDGLSVFFPDETTDALAVVIEVERMGRKIAVDVQRCTDPVRQLFSKSTEKLFIPPFFNLSTDVTACQVYDVTFGMGIAPQAGQRERLLRDAASRLKTLKNQIIRAIMLQRAQVLQTGIVTLRTGDNIDYKRKAASMPVKTGAATWNNLTTANPIQDLIDGAYFIRRTGRSGTTEFNVIMGSAAMANFFGNQAVLDQANVRWFNLVDVKMPQFDNTTGITMRGKFGFGNFIFNIMAYDEYYEDPATGNDVEYIGANNVIILPNDFKGITAFGGLPVVMGDPISGQYVAPQEGAFQVHDVIDQIKTAWDIILRSAPLVVPVSVDRIYTIQTA